MKSLSVKQGIERAPHRSLLKACGFTDSEIQKPLIGIANSANAIIPGHVHLNTILDAVKAGGDRQELHERIREHSQAAGRQVKVEGGDNDLLARLKADPAFATIKDGLDDTLDPARYVGRAPQQVDEFLAAEVQPVLAAAGDAGADAVKTAELKV